MVDDSQYIFFDLNKIFLIEKKGLTYNMKK